MQNKSNLLHKNCNILPCGSGKKYKQCCGKQLANLDDIRENASFSFCFKNGLMLQIINDMKPTLKRKIIILCYNYYGGYMYSLKNEKDVLNILKYHRAKDMVNIMKFFPGLSPVEDLAVILDEADYLENKKKIAHLTSIRNGNPVSELCMKSIPTKEINPDCIEVLRKIKKENKNGVLILFCLNIEPSERYERYAGISVGISLGRKIYIDAVGKGFDGREVLKGISCHERYIIPWEDIRKININNFKEYNTFIISQEEYLKSREERINYLMLCGLPLELLEQNIPKEYQEIPRFIWLDIIVNIIKQLEKEEEYLKNDGFLEFNLSGHTEGNRFRPWQMVDDKRM